MLMGSAFIVWYCFVLLVCGLIVIFMDGEKIKKKDARIAHLERSNRYLNASLQKCIAEKEFLKIKLELEKNSRYYEEL